MNENPHEVFQRKNKRRVSLIGRKCRDGLTAEEEAELAVLEAECEEYMNFMYPRRELPWKVYER